VVGDGVDVLLPSQPSVNASPPWYETVVDVIVRSRVGDGVRIGTQ
jgi:hypothetical protein